jgi:hypothetical protein
MLVRPSNGTTEGPAQERIRRRGANSRPSCCFAYSAVRSIAQAQLCKGKFAVSGPKSRSGSRACCLPKASDVLAIHRVAIETQIKSRQRDERPHEEPTANDEH